ncbi:MAG: transglycosylase domain-containing protein [Actinomycetaceae bacterium]|nr:transglycosylase domain-containing protein [Actinomycetaceae bacterium]MDY5273153.1 transglycosylase domain-containing protein [Arcanobacterium sp.]
MLTERNVTVGQLLGACMLFVLLCATGGALLAATAIPVAAAAGATTNALTGLFEDLPTDIDFTQPSQQSTLLSADGAVITRFYAEDRIVVTSEQISTFIKNAAVAVEDQRFYQHNGVDAQGIIGAIVNNITGGNLAGGSTITQQYVKNALLEEGRIAGDQEKIDAATKTTLARKLNEARYAVALENKATKDQILTSYLNMAQFGPSQWGVESASLYFFGKHAKDVTLAQGATLAALTQAPNYWNPEKNPQGAQERRDMVLSKMLEQGYINQAQHDEAVKTPMKDELKITPSKNGCAAAGIYAHYCATTVNELLQSDLLGKTSAERANRLYRGGLSISGTVKTKDQKAAYDALTGRIAVNDASGAQASLVSVEPGTGKITAMTQNTNYGEPTKDDPSRTTINLNVGQDQGGGVGFQSGSTFKVFTLVTWLAKNHSSYERVNTRPHLFAASTWTNSCFPDQVSDYNPQNAEGGSIGYATVRTVTAQSVNVGYTEMANQLDLCDIWKTANAMGVRRGVLTTEKDLSDKDSLASKAKAQAGQPLPLVSVPAMVLGTNSVTPLSTAQAYATLAADGKRCEPITFTDVKDASGKIIGTNKTTCTQAINSDVARQATSVLQGVAAAGLSDRPSAGKTGTTDDSKNVWFAGYTPQRATAVWVGHKDGDRTLNYTSFNGVYYGEVFGSSIPAPIYRTYMTNALSGEPALQFNQPTKADTPPEPPKIDVPNVVGMKYTEAVQRLRAAGFSVTAKGTLEGNQDQTVLKQSVTGKAEEGTTVDLLVSMPPETSTTKTPEKKSTTGTSQKSTGGNN